MIFNSNSTNAGCESHPEHALRRPQPGDDQGDSSSGVGAASGFWGSTTRHLYLRAGRRIHARPGGRRGTARRWRSGPSSTAGATRTSTTPRPASIWMRLRSRRGWTSGTRRTSGSCRSTSSPPTRPRTSPTARTTRRHESAAVRPRQWAAPGGRLHRPRRQRLLGGGAVHDSAGRAVDRRLRPRLRPVPVPLHRGRAGAAAGLLGRDGDGAVQAVRERAAVVLGSQQQPAEAVEAVGAAGRHDRRPAAVGGWTYTHTGNRLGPAGSFGFRANDGAADSNAATASLVAVARNGGRCSNPFVGSASGDIVVGSRFGDRINTGRGRDTVSGPGRRRLRLGRPEQRPAVR